MGNVADFIPAFKYGHKVYPQNIASALGLPSVGDIFFVDPGKAVSGGGREANDAFKTVAEAYAAAQADNDDVIVIAGTSSTGRTAEADNLTWAKRRLHIVGNGVGRKMNNRNGISWAAAVTGETTTALFTLTATNCIFANISIASFADNNILFEIQSDYNTFINVHFQGIGHDTTGDDTAARSLLITGAGENEFYNCTIGLDTVTRSAANASLELTGSCERNKFFGCDFPLYADNAGAFWVKADTGNCFERFLLFDNCNFFNPTDGSSTGLTAGMKLSATGNGEIRMINSTWNGATDLATDYTCLYSNSPVYDTQDSGKSIKVTT